MKNRNQDGFTLVELLVSLFLLSLMMTIIYGTLSFSTKALERNVKIADKSDEILPAQNLIRDILAKAIPENGKFSGSNIQLSFLTTMMRGGDSKEVYQVSIFEKRNGAASDLVLEWEKEQLIGRRFDREELQGEVVLVSDISDLNISYGAEDFYENKNWQPLWSTNDQRPKFVKIELESKNPWPELVVGLNISHRVDCFYDPVSRGCRYK